MKKNVEIAVEASLLAHASGIGGYYRPLLKAAIEHFSQCHFILLSSESLDTTFLEQNKNYTLQLVSSKKFFKPALSRFWYGGVSIPQTLKRINPTLFLSPYYDCFIPYFLQNKSLFVVHDMCFWDVSHYYHPLLVFYHKNVLKHNLQRTQTVITVSEFSKQRLLHHYPLLQSQDIEIVYNAFSRQKQAMSVQGELVSTIKSMRLAGKKILLYSGGIEHRKNIKAMLEAFALLCKQRQDIILVITGDTLHNENLTAQIKALHLSDTIFQTGRLSDAEIQWLYHVGVDAAVNLSLYEGFGRNNIEAAYSGLPLLCSDIPINHEIIGKYPMYCDPHNVEAIAQALCQIVYKDRTAKMQRDERFSHEMNCTKYITCIEKFVKATQQRDN